MNFYVLYIDMNIVAEFHTSPTPAMSLKKHIKLLKKTNPNHSWETTTIIPSTFDKLEVLTIV